MGEIVRVKENNQLIHRRKTKKRIKKTVFILIFLISLICTLLYKLPYFNINTISVKNNVHVSEEEIISSSKLEYGKNIFYLNKKIYINNIKNNSYISRVAIKRKLPDGIIINVEERKPSYFIEDSGGVYILDKEGILLEVVNSNTIENLCKISGIDISSVALGQKVFTEKDRRLQWLEDYSLLMANNTSDITFNNVDFTDPLNIKIYHKEMKIVLGTMNDLRNKLNKAINILATDNIGNSKGYIDISFNGNPVIYIEK